MSGSPKGSRRRRSTRWKSAPSPWRSPATPTAGKSTLINAIAGTGSTWGTGRGDGGEERGHLRVRRAAASGWSTCPAPIPSPPTPRRRSSPATTWSTRRPDLIINVVDATNLERNLYLTVQLLELGIPVVMALNIYDEAEAKGYRIDVAGDREDARRSPSSPPRPRRRAAWTTARERPGDRRRPRRPRAAAAQLRGRYRDGRRLRSEPSLQKNHPALAGRYPQRWLAAEADGRGQPMCAKEINIGSDALHGRGAASPATGPRRGYRGAHGRRPLRPGHRPHPRSAAQAGAAARWN